MSFEVSGNDLVMPRIAYTLEKLLQSYNCNLQSSSEDCDDGYEIMSFHQDYEHLAKQWK